MISIVIPNLHSPLIDQVVAALDQQTIREHIGEIIIVGQDCHGRVPTASYVHFVETVQPTPHGAARNLGARLARGDYLLFIDADCIAQPQMAERMLERHQQGYPVVGGGLMLERGNYWVRCYNILVFAASLSTVAAGTRTTLPSYALSMRRDVFAHVHGFDETYSIVGEDIDLTLRLRQQGYPLFCEPRATVAHRHSRTTAAAVWQGMRLFGRTHATFWEKYPDLMASRRSMARLRPLAAGILALALLLALRDVLRLYAQTPQLWRCWYALPGLVWGKMAWYWGTAETLMLHRTTPAGAPA